MALAATALVAGHRLTRRLLFESALERALISTSLGIAVLGHLLFLIGLAGFLTALPLVVLLVSLHLLCLPAWREVLQEARAIARSVRPASASALALAAGMLLAPLILLPLYPPASFDSTMYHLPYAKAFASSGGLPFLSSLRFPVFPQLIEVLFAVMFLFADDVAAQSLQALVTLLTVGLLFA